MTAVFTPQNTPPPLQLSVTQTVTTIACRLTGFLLKLLRPPSAKTADFLDRHCQTVRCGYNLIYQIICVESWHLEWHKAGAFVEGATLAIRACRLYWQGQVLTKHFLLGNGLRVKYYHQNRPKLCTGCRAANQRTSARLQQQLGINANFEGFDEDQYEFQHGKAVPVLEDRLTSWIQVFNQAHCTLQRGFAGAQRYSMVARVQGQRD